MAQARWIMTFSLQAFKELEKSFGDRSHQLWIANGRREGPRGF